jgi:prevent-host-death family protein
MKTVPLSEAKAKLSSLLDAVEDHDEEVIITRNGRAAAVLASPAAFESWKETATVRADAERDPRISNAETSRLFVVPSGQKWPQVDTKWHPMRTLFSRTASA